jgi:Family of unknown function (DUF5681)
MPFQPGQSGNPAGRPPGSRNKATIRVQNVLEEDAEKIATQASSLAQQGNVAAVRICMNRLAPVRKNDPIAYELPPVQSGEEAVAAMAMIVRGVADGDLTPAEAAQMAKVINVYLRALATYGFEKRLAKLEPAADAVAANAENSAQPWQREEDRHG